MIWSTNTAGPEGNYRIAMQDDGNLVIYNEMKVIWSTGTSG